MIDKKIYRYSNVELLDIIKNGTNNFEIEKAESEFKSRNLTLEQQAEIEADYLKFKEFQEDRKNKPLTREEWLTFFILPFFTPKPSGRNDHYSESEMERFANYGFKEKSRQANQVKLFGIIFWFILILILALIFN